VFLSSRAGRFFPRVPRGSPNTAITFGAQTGAAEKRCAPVSYDRSDPQKKGLTRVVLGV
jgi:hypothetical protein